MESANRIYGLDVLRATAIFLVVFTHVVGLSPIVDYIPQFTRVGAIGVEMFFVLSGYLIGGIIIRLLHRGQFHSVRDLFHFWLNRWFRTLPLYYIFFLTYCLVHGNFFEQIRQRIAFAFFVQNFAWWMRRDFFGQSWSLSIEEWFYVLFPLLLFSLYAWARLPMRASFLIAAFYFLGGSLALRLCLGPAHSYDDFDMVTRKWVIFRLDALMFGVLAVYLKHERPDLWQWLSARRVVAFLFLGLVCGVHCFGDPILFALPWTQLFLFPAMSLGVALIMPIFAEWKTSQSPIRGIVVGLAKSSYSVYLSHLLPVAAIEKNHYLHTHRLVALPLVIIGITVCGAFSYYCLEAPLMRLRQKWNDRFNTRTRTASVAAG